MVPVPVPTFEKVMVPVPTFENLRFRFLLHIYYLDRKFFPNIVGIIFAFLYIIRYFTREKLINFDKFILKCG